MDSKLQALGAESLGHKARHEKIGKQSLRHKAKGRCKTITMETNEETSKA